MSVTKKENLDILQNGRTVKFEILGQEVLDKKVAMSGHSGRVYLPQDWIGKRVKIIRTD